MPCGCGSTTGADCLCGITSTAGIVVDGNGSAAFPYEISPEVSGTVGNQVQIVGDGFYVPEGAGADLPCFTDGNDNPLLPDTGTGCIRVPQYAGILDYSGQPIAPDSNNNIQLPISGSPPSFGCGLTTLPDGTLVAATSGTYPMAPLSGPALVGSDLTGGVVYCDSDGELRVAPEHTAMVVAPGTVTLFNDDQFITASGSYVTPAYGSVSITNPSSTRTMRIFTVVVSSINGGAAAVGGLDCYLQRDTGGGYSTYGDIIHWPYLGSGSPVIMHENSHTVVSTSSLAPGATITGNYRVVFNNASAGSAVRRSAVMNVQVWGFTQ